MRVLTCTVEKPWGIHEALRDHQCPRCGWAVPDAAPKASELPTLAPWTVITGGMAAAVLQSAAA